MQHYLRHGLLTLLADRRPQTILELIRILTDDDFREPFVDDLADPMLRSFWATQWPAKGERERDTSIKAVLNKLGAFVTYESIRSVVGQGTSTIRPRELMDRGEILLVDLSGVGGDNANLFGAMLVSRYYVDALGRQTIPREERRQHVLIIDEAQRFGTRALENISVEGRKFGLALALASQSLGSLSERLGHTILTNAASIALLAPGAEDVRGLARLFAPVTAEQLSGLRAYEVVLRMPGRDGRPTVAGGLILPPDPPDPAVSAEIVAASDRRDTRPLAEVQAEVRERAGGEDDAAPGRAGPPDVSAVEQRRGHES
jgi:DNA helicase HerA-like ATPase